MPISPTISTAAKAASPKQSTQAPAARRWYGLALLLISAAIYFGTAFRPALLDDADASHALVSVEMLQRGDWSVMYMNGIRWLMKAPLHYWMVAAGYAIFGQNEFATRLPVALSMVLLALMCYEFGKRFFSARAGFYAGLVAATSVGMFIFTRIMIPEAIYALQFTAIFYLFLRGWTGSMEKRMAYWGVAAVMALAVLTRGLIGIVFPLGAMIGFIILTRSWHRWRELFGLAHVGVLSRPGVARTWPAELAEVAAGRWVSDAVALREQPCGKVIELSVTPLEISATRIRDLLRAGREPRYLLPCGVFDDGALLAPYRTG